MEGDVNAGRGYAGRGGRGRGGGRWARHRAAQAAAAAAAALNASDDSGGPELLHDAGSGVPSALAHRPVRTVKPSSKVLAATSSQSPPPPSRRGRSASAGDHSSRHPLSLSYSHALPPTSSPKCCYAVDEPRAASATTCRHSCNE